MCRKFHLKNGILVQMNRLWRYFEEIVLEVMVDEDVIMFVVSLVG